MSEPVKISAVGIKFVFLSSMNFSVQFRAEVVQKCEISSASITKIKFQLAVRAAIGQRLRHPAIRTHVLIKLNGSMVTGQRYV